MAYAIRHTHSGQVTTASGLDVLAGIWLLISPWCVGFSAVSGATSNDVIFGIIIGILALVRFFNNAASPAVSWINAILGIWVLISPWVLGFGHVQAFWVNNLITGIVVIVLACWSALATNTTAATSTTEYPNDLNRPAM